MSPVNIILAVAGTQGVLNAMDSVRGALGGVAATALGTTSALTGVKTGLDLGGELNDLSARTGQTVRDLVIMQRALDNAGIGGANTGQYIGLLQKAIAGLNEEGGKTDAVFKKLQLDPAKLKLMGVREQLDALTQGFARIENPAERSTLAMQLFGRSGAQMLQLLGDSSAMSTAAQETGRLADKLERVNAEFDATGDRLSVGKVRLQEFWVVAAEKALPTLTKMADVLEWINPSAAASAFGSVATLFAFGAATKFIGSMDTAVLSWATSPTTSAAGTAFASTFLAPLTAGLSKLMQVALPALIGYQIGRSIGDAFRAWRQGAVDDARTGDSSVTGALNQAGAIDSEASRAAALEKILALQRQITTARAEENAKIFSSDAALRVYDQQLTVLRSMVSALNSSWAQHAIVLNQANSETARLAKTEAIAKAWITGDDATLAQLVTDAKIQKQLLENSAEKLRDTIAKGILDRSTRDNPEAALANARAYLAINERMLTITKQEREAGRNTAENQKLNLEAAARREVALQTIAALEDRIARRTSEQAQLELNATLRGVEQRRANLEGDIGQTDAQKWPQRKTLLAEEIAAQGRYLDVLQERLKVTSDLAAREALQSQISSGLDRLSGLGNQDAQLGAAPSSFAQQMIAANTAAQNSIGTTAQLAARTWSQSADSIRTSMGTAMGDMVLTSGSAGDKVKAAGWSIAQSFVRNTAQMVADWIYQHTVLAAVHAIFQSGATSATAAGSATRSVIRAGEAGTDMALTGAQTGAHIAGENTKTAWTFFGALKRGLIRLGETIFHGIQVGLRVALHLAGEVLQTGITLVQSGIRIAAVIAESLVYVVKAAVGALSALASIPYVGPFLAVAAMVGILAAGRALVNSATHKEKGGIVEGGEQLVWMNEKGREFVFSAPAVSAIGEDRLNAMHTAARSGDFSSFAQAAAPATGSATGITADAAAGGGHISVAYFNDETEAQSWLVKQPAGRKVLYRRVRQDRSELGIKT